MAGLMDGLDGSYSTADVLARLPDAKRLTERERRRLMQKEIAGIGLLDEEARALENDAARRGMASDAAAEAGIGLMAELTGVPSVIRGVGNVKRGYDEGDTLRGAGGAGEIAMGLIPGAAMTRAGGAAIKSAFSTIPKAGFAGAAMTLPMAMVESAEAQQAKNKQKASNWQTTTQAASSEPAASDPLEGLVRGNPTLEARYNLLKQKEIDAKASVPGVGRASSDAVRQKASEEAAQIRSELLAAIDRETANKAAAKTAEDNKNKSVREIYSEYMPYIPVATSILGGVGGGVIKGMYSRAHNAKLANTSESWRKAVDASDSTGASAAQAEMTALTKKGPGGTGPAIAFGGTLGLHNALLPEEIDLARAQPGSKLAEDVWSRLTDASGMTKRLGFGALSGAAPALSTAEITGALMKSAPKTYGPETEALRRKLTQEGVADVGALTRFDAAKQKGIFELDLQGIQNRGRLASAEVDALTSEQIAREALQRSNAQKVGLLGDAASMPRTQAGLMDSLVPASPPRQPPQPVPVQSPSLPPQPVSANVPQLTTQKKGHEFVEGPKGLMELSPAGPWAESWSGAAREALTDLVKSGRSLAARDITAAELRDQIASRLPSGVKPPSLSEIKDRMATMREYLGPKPTAKELGAVFKADKGGRFYSAAPAAIGAGGAAGLGLMSFED